MGSITSPDESLPLVDQIASINHPKSHSKDVHVLSLAFLLVFSAYGAVQNLESTVNDVSCDFIWVQFFKFQYSIV